VVDRHLLSLLKISLKIAAPLIDIVQRRPQPGNGIGIVTRLGGGRRRRRSFTLCHGDLLLLVAASQQLYNNNNSSNY